MKALEFSGRLFYEIIFGTAIVLFGIIFIVISSNKIVNFKRTIYQGSDVENVLLHLCIIVFMIVVLRYILTRFIKNKEVFTSLFSFVGPVIGAGSLYLAVYIKNMSNL